MRPALAGLGLTLLLAACGYPDPTPAAGPAYGVAATTPTPVAGADDFSQGAAQKPVKLPDGLQYVDITVGTGDVVLSGANVQVQYTGWLSNGTKFDSSRDRGAPATFQIGVGAVIPGWDEAVVTMKVGGTRKLILPPALGYGAAGQPPTIPQNSTLVFVVELLSTAPTPSPSPSP